MQERYSHGHDDSVLNSYRSHRAADTPLLVAIYRPTCACSVGCGPITSISADFADVLAQRTGQRSGCVAQIHRESGAAMYHA